MPKPTKPEIELAVVGQKAKASTYNDNFQTMLDYVDDCMDYAVTADLSNLDTDGENHFDTKYVKKTNVANKGSATTPVYFNASGVATACTGINTTNLCCTTKATTTSSASSTKPAVVVENYVNGTSWYRVWSDGWIEQGDRVTTKGANSITFLKPYTTTNYTIIGAPSLTNTSYGYAVTINTTSIAKTGFDAYFGYTSGSHYDGGWWQTAGY